MPDFILKKLVRDSIPGIMKSAGQTPVFHAINGVELQEALLDKLIEEAKEAINAINDDSEFPKEIADIQEIIDSLMVLRGIDKAAIAALQKKISDKKGAFREGYFLERVTVDENSEWAQYYRNEPDRFPEE